MSESTDLRARMNRWDADGHFVEDWFCDIPPSGAEYRVVRDEWNDDYTVRRILEVELTGA